MIKPTLENVLVDCLHDTLNIMLCTDSIPLIRSIEHQLQRYRCYSLFSVKSTGEMDELLRQVRGWHAVVVDELDVLSQDYLQRVAHHASWLPVIALGGGGGKPAAAEESAGRFTVEAAGLVVPLLRCSHENQGQLLQLLHEWCIKRKLFSLPPQGMVAEAVEVLFRDNPFSVSAWAQILQTTQRKFQRQFKLFTELSPKKFLALYHAYRIAFAVVDEGNCRRGVVSAYVLDDRSRERIMEYVLTRRSSLLVGQL